MIEPISTKEYLWGVFLWRVRPVLFSCFWFFIAVVLWQVFSVWHMTATLPITLGFGVLNFWGYSEESDSDDNHSERYARWLKMHRWLKVESPRFR